ncbi:hypothetical protein SAMN05421788_113167 [Filimonas lacunae]|uniref:Uncharacterized protein n=1 Tax=Filimonas lacunae TaxID=477680 RepID=A0A173MBE7_9BACT|nr:hypothetical protein [Filimonas lacunae]BAV04884.1 hypothetical protein FLA_0884 [Filimonas lacunae]SIT33853.1 hypothetical protein SAMN05421788_113167 [Filimonas lacunae]
MYEETEEFKEYIKAYQELLHSVLQVRFPWKESPEDFLALVLLTYKAAITGPAPLLTEEEKAAGITLPDIDTIAAVLEEWLQIRYQSYKDFQDLKQNGQPSDTLFNEKSIRSARHKRKDFLVAQATRHAAGIVFSPDTKQPHPITQLWAEAFMHKLTERIKPHDNDLCEIVLADNIHKGAFMAI